jgi:ribose transport system ATP-binding protein
MNLLHCRNLRCSFGGAVVLDDLDLTVGSGEAVGIIGENGAGKTTLINAICGLAPISAGSIFLNGCDVSSWSFEERSRAGIVRSFEDAAVWKGLPVLDNVAAGAIEHPLEEARESASRWLKLLELSQHEHDFAENLSLGERRKVELARILLRRESLDCPALVILDEPTRGLDDNAREGFLNLIEEHLRGRCSLLIVEHSREVISRLCSRAVVLRAGVLADAPSESDGPRDSDSKDSIHSASDSCKGSLAIRVDNLHASYGSIKILNGVSLTLAAGEAMHLNGRNGSGKSSLLRAVVGSKSITPTSGTIELFGTAADNHPNRVAAGLGYAPQGGRLISNLSVDTHLKLARNLAVSAGRKADMADQFERAFPEVSHLGPKAAGDLSSGQRSLVALWTALATEPKTLIADEPGAGLSEELRERVYGFLRKDWLISERSLLFVEHGSSHPWARAVLIDRGVVRNDTL